MTNNITQTYTVNAEIVEGLLTELKESTGIIKLFSTAAIPVGKDRANIGTLFPSMFSRSNSTKLGKGIKREQLAFNDMDIKLKGKYFYVDFPRDQMDLGVLTEPVVNSVFENSFNFSLIEYLIDIILDLKADTKYTEIVVAATADQIGTTDKPEVVIKQWIADAKKTLKVKTTDMIMTMGEDGFRQMQTDLSAKIAISTGALTTNGELTSTIEEFARYFRLKEIVVIDDMTVNQEDEGIEQWGNSILFSKTLSKAGGTSGLFNGSPSVIFAIGKNMQVKNMGNTSEVPEFVTIEKASYMGHMAFQNGFYAVEKPFLTYVQ